MAEAGEENAGGGGGGGGSSLDFTAQILGITNVPPFDHPLPLKVELKGIVATKENPCKYLSFFIVICEFDDLARYGCVIL